MWETLDLLVITFIVMSVISVLGLAFMYLVRNEKVKKGIFYGLCIWGIIVAWCGFLSTRLLGTNYLALALGALSIIAFLIQMFLKKEYAFTIAKILITVSIVAGMVNCFIL